MTEPSEIFFRVIDAKGKPITAPIMMNDKQYYPDKEGIIKPTLINTPQGSIINNVYVPNNGSFQYYDAQTKMIRLGINVCGSLFELEQSIIEGAYKITRPIKL